MTRERLVDERVVDLGVAELDRALEELGHQHVLPLGRELDEAVRLGAGHAGVADRRAARSPPAGPADARC